MRSIALTAAAALVFAGSPGAIAAGPNDVAIVDNSYDPGTITVTPGATVTWTHAGNFPHSVTADDSSWDSSPAGCSTTATAGCMSGGQTFQRAFPAAGSFRYYCKVHGGPNGQGMSGTVQVSQAADPTSVPTSVTSLSGSPVAGGVQLSGMASFGGQKPVAVAEDPVGDAPGAPEAGETTGVDLIGATLSVPDPANPELLVRWKLTGLPPSGGIPEGTRYSLPFKIGTKEFQVQAKFSNLSSITVTDDPQGHVSHVGGSFQLRGNCTTSWNGSGVAYCYHLMWLTGGFDTTTDTVFALVPLGSSAAPDIRSGAMLERNTSTNANLNMVIAGYQAVLALSPQTNDESPFGITEEETYAFPVAKKEVALGVAPTGTDPAAVDFSTPATLGANDGFSGTVSTAGFAAGTYDVFARACFGTNCGIRSLGGVNVQGEDAVAVLKLPANPGDPDTSSAFWNGGTIGDDTQHSLPLVGDNGISTCANAPCFRYTLKVASPGALRLRIALDTITRNDNFSLQVTAPGGAVTSGTNANAFNKELFINNPAVGSYKIVVRPYSASNTAFAMRAKLETQLPVRTPDANGLLLPDLRPTAPYELGFIAPLNPANGVFPPDDVNPPADVAGVHPVSCAADETAEDGSTKCLRFSFGLTNNGQGNFDIRWSTASNAQSGPMIQCVQHADGTVTPRPAGGFSLHTTHGHTHYEDIIFLKLQRVTDPAAGTMVQAGDGRKLGYSPADQAFVNWYAFDQAAAGSSSSAGNCDLTKNERLGMSIGWGDVYRYQRPGNYVDFGTNTDGLYVVQLTADPLNNVLEANEANNTSYSYVRVTGDRVDVLEHGRGQSPWDPNKQILQPRWVGGVPW